MRYEASLSIWFKSLASLCMLGLLTGCATTPLHRARAEFYAGRLENAATSLTPLPEEDKDQILFLMERGMVLQELGKYEESSADWRKAIDQNEFLETYSISRGATSYLTSDRVLSFRGKPFERTLLFSFLANNYLAQHNWDYAAICARNIIQQLENLNGFPDIAYSRYMAGFGLEMIGDMGNAALQYRTASDLIPFLSIDENTGGIKPEFDMVLDEPLENGDSRPYELICFVAMGKTAETSRSTSSYQDDFNSIAPERMPYAEFYHNGEYLGRSYPFNNTEQLFWKTKEQLALLQAAKDISRFALKETISHALEQQNELLGFLARSTLFALEAPDTRRWETLPRWLSVARLRASEPISSYTVVFKEETGYPIYTKTVTSPIARRGNIFISFCRNIPDRNNASEVND